MKRLLVMALLGCWCGVVRAQTYVTHTLNFNDLKLVDNRGRPAPELVLPDRYVAEGLRVTVGPGYVHAADKIEASANPARPPVPADPALRTNDALNTNDADYPSMVL